MKLTPSKPSSQSLSTYFVIFEHARNFTASPTNAIQTAMKAWRIIDAMKMLVLRTKTIIKYSIKYYNRAFISRRIQWMFSVVVDDLFDLFCFILPLFCLNEIMHLPILSSCNRAVPISHHFQMRYHSIHET